VACILAVLVYDVMRLRRRVVEDNLSRAFGGHMTVRERRRIGRRCYEELAVGALEIAWMTRMSPSRVAAECRVEGIEFLEAVRASGTGCILATGHLGNWEYLAACMAARGMPITAVGAPMRNRRVDRWLHDFRTGFGMELIRRGRSSGRAAVRALRAGRMLLLLVDQDARRAGVFVDFFGHPASTPVGAASLALHTGAPIIPCRIIRDDGGHVLRVYPPLVRHSAVDRREWTRATMQEITTMLESWIRERPSSWFWPHRRFKTRPDPATNNVSSNAREGDHHGLDPPDHQA
jgi:KDO2-lipid IV(A) lauroyltransferase